MNSYGVVSGNDIELINAVPDGYLSEIQQLSSGPLGCRVEWLKLPGMSIQKHRFTAALRWEEQRVEHGLALAVLQACDGPFGVQGVEFGCNDVLLQPFGSPLEYIMRPNMHALGIQLTPDLTNSLGWSASRADPNVVRASDDSMQTFVRVCLQALQSSRGWGGIDPAPSVKMALRDRVLARLEHLLQPWLRDLSAGRFSPTTNLKEYLLVKRAETWFDAHKPGDELRITEIANDLEVPMRTLQRAFNTWTGISPGRYFFLYRLHQFRKRLHQVEPISGAVTRAAIDTGFSHLGRLAGDFRKIFGETPSETLNRWESNNSIAGKRPSVVS